MLELLLNILYFLIAISLLVAVHEFGHFWVARRLGIKVLRFSIGFGRVIWRHQSRDGETEYAISALPLGGYVKMLDEREGEVDPAERHRAFNCQGVAKRFAVVAAGPLFNLAFAVFAYWLMFIIGVTGIKPLVGEVPVDTPAYQAGLSAGQTIIAVEGELTPTWGAVMEQVLPRLLLKEDVALTIEERGNERALRLPLSQIEDEIRPEQVIDKTGLVPFRPLLKAVIGQVVEGAPAALAGLRVGDEVVVAAGERVSGWRELVAIIQAHAGEPLSLELLRSGRSERLVVTPDAVTVDGVTVGKIGAAVAVDSSQFDQYRSEERYGPIAALPKAVAKTWDMSLLTLKMMGEMIVGRASVDNISGPITIAQFAKSSAEAGISPFLGFLAIVSLSLGILNLLPIPVLDGGHLLFYLVEIVTGRPVSEQVEAVGQKIGLSLIMLLMFVAFYNDFARLGG